MVELSKRVLQKSVIDLHGCKATWVASAPVRETFQGKTVWEGFVEIFDLEGHPTAKRCYAWAHPIDDSKKIKFYAVLHHKGQ